MEAAHHEPVAATVEHRQGEALIASGVLERIEANQPDPSERTLEIALHDRGPARNAFDVTDDLADAFHVAAEHGFERLGITSAGQAVESSSELSGAPKQQDDRDEEDDEDGCETDHDRADVGGDHAVEIDRTSSGRLRSSLASADWRSLIRGWFRGGPVYPSAAMAKRTKYTDRPGSKPGARPAAARPARPAAAPVPARSSAAPAAPAATRAVEAADDMPVASSGGLTEAEIARAAQLEAEQTAREKAAITESLKRRAVPGPTGSHAAHDVNAPLSVRMSHEYAYVARDVKRILLTAGLMAAILVVLDILVNVTKVISL